MICNSTSKGNYGELHIEALLRLQGFQTSRPTGADCPYDLVVDYNNQLRKCQIKTATSHKGTLHIKLTNGKVKRHRNDYANVDNFLVCDLLTARVFVIPNPGAQSVKLTASYDTSTLGPYLLGRRWLSVYEQAWHFFGATFKASELFNIHYNLRTAYNILKAQRMELCGYDDSFLLNQFAAFAALDDETSKKFLKNMGVLCYPYSYTKLMQKLEARVAKAEEAAQKALQGA